MNVLVIMFCTRAYIEITCCAPFSKSYKPVSEVVSTKIQQAITFEKGTQHVFFMHIQKECMFPNIFYVEHMP
jgi:hypothetical protein